MTNALLVKITRYASLLGGGLVTGGALATLVLELALRRLGGTAYVEVRQAEHAYFPWYIGAIFVPTLVAVVMLVLLARKDGSPALRPAAAALALLVLSLVVTFAVNAPINIDQIGWDAQAPPADWASIRDRWQIAHAVRTVMIVIALGCIGAAATDRSHPGYPVRATVPRCG
ncbi:anthrone oxygenase family protein [Actinacidiphila glaucinigra]|uniref:anthrone oxygenase family protein n=1 Tax=Actinacidiphila glaucinigra TaxID=235986 RepID=UPI0033E53340